MKTLLETIVKGIVNNPDQVVVEENASVDFPGLTIFKITVADDDKGILIGRRGRTINSIRDLMTISAIRNDKRIKVLVNEGEGDTYGEGRKDQDQEASQSKGEEAPKPEETEELSEQERDLGVAEDDNSETDDVLNDEI